MIDMSAIGQKTNIPIQTEALGFDLSDVTKRYVETYGVSAEIAELHERECKRWLMLCSLYPKAKLGMKGPVDNYWHTFLLFTKDYHRFCDVVAGFFIHHVPNMKKDDDGDRESFPKTMRLYQSVFGEEPDSRAWPYVHHALNADCSESDGASADCKDDCSSGPGTSDCSPSKDCSGEDDAGSGV